MAGAAFLGKKRRDVETINNVELKDENIFPDEEVLQKILGKSHEAYTSLLDLFARHDMTTEWRYYPDGKAWLCKVQRKKKTIVWMSAWSGYMQATVYFPLRLLDSVLALDLSNNHYLLCVCLFLRIEELFHRL